MDKTPMAVRLPLEKTVYQTFVPQGSMSCMIHENPSIRNWFLNENLLLRCNRIFYKGRFSSPEITIEKSHHCDCPHLECEKLSAEFLRKNVHTVIRNALNAGYYIVFEYIDDYFIKGKSWYHKWHVSHNGMIFGYDQEDRTYDLLSYDERWIFRPYKTPQRGVEKGILSAADTELYSRFYFMKPKDTIVEINPRKMLKSLKEYLDSSMEKYPPEEDQRAFGIVVHDYLAMYMDCLYSDYYPHERIDHRSYRMIWEHKKVVHESLQAVEDKLNLDHTISDKYTKIVYTADTLRNIYTGYCIKPRKPLLLKIKKDLLQMKEDEMILLQSFVEKAEEVLRKKEGT